jgi:hypothetical protein
LQNQVKKIVAADDEVIERMRVAIKTGGKARRKK